MAKQPRQQPIDTEKRQGVGYDRPEGCLIRLFWMGFGNLLLVILAMAISQRQGLSALDAGYWAVVAALAGTRYADISRFNGLTANGEPATMRHFRRYVLGLVVAATALWACVHLVPLLV